MNLLELYIFYFYFQDHDIDENFVKLFRLAQMIIEYLLVSLLCQFFNILYFYLNCYFIFFITLIHDVI